MIKHQSKINCYHGSLEELGIELAGLRFDSLASYTKDFAHYLYEAYKDDSKNKRTKLSNELLEVARCEIQAYNHLRKAQKLSTDEINRPEDIDSYPFSLDHLAEKVERMKYDSTAKLSHTIFSHLHGAAEEYAEDFPEVSREISEASVCKYNATKHLIKAWQICEPYMKK